MTGLPETLSPEAPSVSVEGIKNVLQEAGLREAVSQGFVVIGAGFAVRKLDLPEGGYESVVVEYKPERSWAPVGPAHDKQVWERSIAVEAEMLTRYQEALSAAGLNVTRLNRTPNGRQAWLSIR
jgi:hypothetical protein